MPFDDKQAAPFRLPIRVYIEDTDAGGVVFYANYLRFMERARTEFIRSLGFQRVILLESGVNYVVHSLSIQYHKPARLEDELVVTVQVTGLGKSYIDFQQEVRMASTDAVLTTGKVRVACVDTQSVKPRRLPETLVSALQQVLKSENKR